MLCRQENGAANGGREICIQLGGKIAPASQAPSPGPSDDDLTLDADPDPSFHHGMRITFKVWGLHAWCMDSSRHHAFFERTAKACCGCAMLAQDLTYTVKSHHDRKMQVSLLTSISGFFHPGQMSALVSRQPPSHPHMHAHVVDTAQGTPGKP